MKKECGSCGITKALIDFTKDDRKSQGVSNECKGCVAARARAKRRGITCVKSWHASNWKCTNCLVTKDLTEKYFYKVRSRITDFDTMCRDCRNDYHRKNRRDKYNSVTHIKQREKNNIAERDYHRNAKIACINYTGNKCIDCNIQYDGTNAMIFDFHHVDPKLKSFGILTKNRKSLEAQKDELDKCVLLCANCHRKRHSTSY